MLVVEIESVSCAISVLWCRRRRPQTSARSACLVRYCVARERAEGEGRILRCELTTSPTDEHLLCQKARLAEWRSLHGGDGHSTDIWMNRTSVGSCFEPIKIVYGAQYRRHQRTSVSRLGAHFFFLCFQLDHHTQHDTSCTIRSLQQLQRTIFRAKKQQTFLLCHLKS